jgi:hypothetical protein
MRNKVIGPTESEQSDDIVSELCSSSREASVNFVPFAAPEMWDVAHKVVLSQTAHIPRAAWRGRGP